MKFLNTLLKVKVINYGCNLLIILNKLLNCIILLDHVERSMVELVKN